MERRLSRLCDRSAQGSTLGQGKKVEWPIAKTHVYTKGQIEDKPEDDNGSKSTTNLCNAKRLDEKKQDEDGAAGADDRGLGDAGVDYLQAIGRFSQPCPRRSPFSGRPTPEWHPRLIELA